MAGKANDDSVLSQTSGTVSLILSSYRSTEKKQFVENCELI